MKQKFPEKKYFEQTWASSIWEFCSKYGITVAIKEDILFPKRRVGDRAIMERSNGMGSKLELRAINNCRMWLQVFNISDIMTNDGSEYLEWAIKGSNKSKSILSWPHTNRPGEDEWKNGENT